MSLGVAIKGAEGIVLAADSRVTLGARTEGGNVAAFLVHYDNASKLLNFSTPHNYVGAVTYGLGIIGQRTPHSYVPELELGAPKERMSVKEFAEYLSAFFMERWREALLPIDGSMGNGVTFLVGGYDPEAPYGSVYVIEIPNSPEPSPRNAGKQEFGMTWGGQNEIATRLIQGFDANVLRDAGQKLGLAPDVLAALQREIQEREQVKIPYHVLPLQDCIDLATFLIRTTMTAQQLSFTVRGVGGEIEVAVITRTKGLDYVQKKQLRGELHHHNRGMA